jgi:hypothetical protein
VPDLQEQNNHGASPPTFPSVIASNKSCISGASKVERATIKVKGEKTK